MEQKILDLLSQKDYMGNNIDEIATILGYDHSQDFKELVKCLVRMEDEGKIKRGILDRYFLANHESVIIGTVQLHARGYAFIRVDDEEQDDIYVGASNLNGALNGDKVKIELIGKQSGNSLEGKVVEIIQRGLQQVVGLVKQRKGRYLILVDDPKFNSVVYLDGDRKGAMEGHKVVVEMTKFTPPYKGKVVRIIGHKNDPGVDILSIVARYDIPVEFDQKVMDSLVDIPDEVSQEDKQGRVDLRDELIVTIDGDDAKDLDDAISLKKLKNGNYKLGVHIADVSHYVKEDSELDKSAVERGTSVYLVDRVIPMLPHKLSNGICSLNPRVDRLTISCIMEIDPHGEVVSHEILPTLIHSSERMTYNNVNKILDGDKKVTKRYQDIYKLFFLMEELAIILRTKRNKKGAIDFDVNEAKVIVDKRGKPTDIVLRTRGMAEKMIEEFMLVANETVAEHFKWLDVPFIYRVHEHPKKKKLLNFATVASTLGYKVKGSLDHVYPKELSDLLESTKGTEEHSVISTLLLRCMQKARYDSECLGHYGLADEYYTHFTSPIRRYPDLLVHRLIHTYLFENKMDEKTIEHFSKRVPMLAESSSAREIDAVNCERDVDSMKMAEYMSRHIGEEFDGIISSVTGFGFFVELPNTIDGLVHISTLMDDYYHYDEQFMMLIGEMTGKKYKMSDKVRVKVVSASKIDAQIDFEVVTKKPKKRKVREFNTTATKKKQKQPYYAAFKKKSTRKSRRGS